MRQLVFGWVLLAGCGDEAVSLDTDDTDGGTTLPVGCNDGSPVDTYVAGIETSTVAGGYVIRIAEAAPAPPDVGTNVLTLEVETAAGERAGDAAVTVTPWMPLHGHGTVPPDFTATDDGTAWTTGAMDLFMPGLWELTVSVGDGEAAESAVFRFCLEG